MDRSEYVPRIPTRKEIRELKRLNMVECGDTTAVDNAYIAVFDRYCTGCPGYCGKVMSVIWDGSPSTFDVYTWRDGELHHVKRD